MQRLYEDNIEGNICDKRFAKMNASYEAEQHTRKSWVAELKSATTSEKESALMTYECTAYQNHLYLY